MVNLISISPRTTGRFGEITLNPFASTVNVPIAARRAIHNLGPIGLKVPVTIDLIEMPEMQHIGIRVYLDQIAPLDLPDKMKVIDRMNLMQSILRGYGVSCSLEKVLGSPPKR
jgi:hypothetical protein